MRTVGLVWGVVLAMAYGATAAAAPKTAAPQGGAAGAAATAASGAPPAPAPSSVPAPDAATAPDTTTPTPDTTTPIAPEDSNAEAEEEEEQEPPRKKRKHRRRARSIAAEETEEEPESLDAPETDPPPVEGWRFAGKPHFLVSVERITNAVAWSVTETRTIESSNSNFIAPTTLELTRSGTDVSFLGSGASDNVFGVPRIALDGMLGNGLTLGGSLSYMVVSAKHEVVDADSTKSSIDDGSASVFILAPRIGVMIPTSPTVAIWLRAGVSRIAASRDLHVANESGLLLNSTVTSTLTLVNITLDPQLVITPVPHVGITLGALLDIGVSGSAETSFSTMTQDVTSSSYGVTGGLVAIF